jgi:uncharacterized membrane protein
MSPHRIFLWLALPLGLLYAWFTPPFQVPDEPNHFMRAWQLSQGQWIATVQDHRVGGEVPASFMAFKGQMDRVIAGARYTADSIAAFSRSLETHPRITVFADFNNTAQYSAVCYAPAALFLCVGNVLGCKVNTLLYGARISTLLAWILLVWCAIRLIPFCKWIFTACALLPMSLFINSAVHADAVTNGLAFLFIGYVLHLCVSEKTINAKTIVSLTALLILLALTKTVYATLAGLLLLLPVSKFSHRSHKWITVSILLLVTAITLALWTHVISRLYIPYDAYNPGFRMYAAMPPGTDMHRQAEWLLQHPSNIISVLRKSLALFPQYHVPGYTGTFGWLDIVPPAWFSYLLFVVLLAIALLRDNSNSPSSVLRAACIVIFFITLCLIFLSQYLTWHGIGASQVRFIQGRYLIPVYPLLFLAVSGITRRSWNHMPLAICIIFAAANMYALLLINDRYY